MTLTMLKGKIHRAVVKQADLNYVGSITIDSELMKAAGILEYEMVQIVDVENGNRFETYTIAGEPGSGIICLNGAAAHCVTIGDKVIIMAYANMSPEEAAFRSLCAAAWPRVTGAGNHLQTCSPSGRRRWGRSIREMCRQSQLRR